jgi:hypothetical protein
MDNASAKVTLQEMMDRALFETSSYAALMHQPQKSTDQFNENGFLNSVSAPQISKRSTYVVIINWNQYRFLQRLKF